MRKALSIVALLVVALMFSANLPRAGPDMDTVPIIENTIALDDSLDVGAIFGVFSAELFTIEHAQALMAISSPREARSPLVIRNQRDELIRYASAPTSLDSRTTHRTDNGWKPMRT